MNNDKLYGGKSPYQVLEEMDLLRGLTDAALSSAYHQHKEHVQQHAGVYNEAEAQVFEYMMKNNPAGLAAMKWNEPEKFERWQESYLRRAEYLSQKK